MVVQKEGQYYVARQGDRQWLGYSAYEAIYRAIKDIALGILASEKLAKMQ